MTAVPSTPKRQILIVEDEQAICDLYKQLLEQEGYHVDVAHDGNEGYAKIYKGGYDLVLLDIMLPNIDGITILKKITNEQPPMKPNKAIVILTNVGQDLTIAKGMEFGIRGYMIKSDYTPPQFIKEVK